MQKYKFKLINKMKVALCFIILTFSTKNVLFIHLNDEIKYV